ncbi:MAG: acyltransferase [Colwellia sp.]|nr:acyltransferase [Colwellia sp.]
MTRFRGLSGLRGLAALAVFAVHYNQIVDIDIQVGIFDFFLLFANGEYGVALFFILSGLLLSQPYWKSLIHQQPWPNTKVYFTHRMVRILPAFYLTLTLIIVTTDYWKFPQAWPDIILHYSLLFNYAEFAIFSLNPPFWTLAIEIQFYCLLPFLFRLIRNDKIARVFISLVILSVITYILHYWISSSISTNTTWPGNQQLVWIRPYGAVVSHSLLAHSPHFIIGIISGGILLKMTQTMPRHEVDGNWRYDVFFGICLSLCLLLLSTPFSDRIQVPFGRYSFPLIPLLIAGLLISTPLTKYSVKLLDSKALKQLGAISYGIYLYHFPILALVDRKMANLGLDAQQHWGYLAIFSLTITLLAATISYYLIERPMIKLALKKQITI